MADDSLSNQAARARLDAYVGELAVRLRGPRRRRQRVLAELRDGLDGAVDARITDGQPEGQAVTAAIAEFGSPETVAHAFGGELATAYARRTVTAYIVTGPLVGIWWLLLVQPHPWRTGLIALVVAIPVLPLIAVAVATAVTTLATTGRLMRWLPEASPHRALSATIAIAVIVLAADAAVIAAYARSDLALRPLAMVAISASLVRIGCSVTAICHAVARLRALPKDSHAHR